jgi:hypothetical protein
MRVFLVWHRSPYGQPQTFRTAPYAPLPPVSGNSRNSKAHRPCAMLADHHGTIGNARSAPASAARWIAPALPGCLPVRSRNTAENRPCVGRLASRQSRGLEGQVRAWLDSVDCFSRDTGGLSRCLCAIIAADLFKRGLHLAAFMSGHGLALL